MNSEDMYNVISEISPAVLDEAEKYKFTKDYTPFKILAAAACILFLICGSIPVMAACNNETAIRIMYMVVPSLAQRLRPVAMSCEKNGITMEVVGMELDNDKASVLVSMNDTEGRLTDSCDLFDSYGIRTNSASVAGAGMSEFDEETGTAYFLIQIDQMGIPIKEGDKIAFSVGEILPGKEHYDLEMDMIDLSRIPDNIVMTRDYEYRGGGGPGLDGKNLSDISVMVTDPSEERPLADGVALTGYGINDGILHVQIRYTDIFNTDNHGYIYLIDPNGEKVLYDMSVAWFDEDRTDSYEEYFLCIPEGGFDGYRIMGEFWTCNDGPIEGPWSVTIPVSMLE
jgi:hypothetical protein